MNASRYARWAATLAVLLAVSVAGVYGWRYVRARRAQREAPPPVPLEVEKRSDVFSFSKVEGDRTLFTVRASRATEFKEGGRAQLQDVWITIHGRGGKRFDNIHTRECEYIVKTGRISCAGEVQLDLESAEEARQRPGERVIHVGTTGITFDRESGEVRTENPVIFRFPYGQGRGTGATYSTRDAVFKLHRDIEVTLTANRAGARSSEPVTMTGSSIEYARDSRVMRLLPPVRVVQGARELTAGELSVSFDANLRANRLLAGGKPRLRSTEPQGKFDLTSDEMVTLFDSAGNAQTVIASGNVAANLKGAAGEEHIRAGKIEVALAPQRSEPRLLTASEGVTVDSSAKDGQRRITTDAVRVFFAGGGQPSSTRLERGETLAAARFEFRSGDEQTIVAADRFTAQFDEHNAVSSLEGRGNSSISLRRGQGPAQLVTSRDLRVGFDPTGNWSDVELTAGVRFQEAGRTAEGERARMVRSEDLLVLTGNAAVADSLSRTTAASFSFRQRSGDIRAEGGVRTSYLRAERDGITNLSSQPAHIAADSLAANRNSGSATYSGHARMWQGEAIIEADAIDLFRNEKRLEAHKNVNALLPQAARERNGAGNGPVMWRVRAGQLTYQSGEGRVLLEQDVSAKSSVGEMASRVLEMFLSPDNSGRQFLGRAVATGGVAIRQGERRGSAERGEYTAAEGKFTLSGGKPTLFDSQLGTTTGRQLTFFLTDDRILVDSEEGTRTLSRHRVEK